MERCEARVTQLQTVSLPVSLCASLPHIWCCWSPCEPFSWHFHPVSCHLKASEMCVFALWGTNLGWLTYSDGFISFSQTPWLPLLRTYYSLPFPFPRLSFPVSLLTSALYTTKGHSGLPVMYRTCHSDSALIQSASRRSDCMHYCACKSHWMEPVTLARSRWCSWASNDHLYRINQCLEYLMCYVPTPAGC